VADEAYDNHFVWRIIENNRAAAQQHAPDGYQAIVEAHLLYREAPIVVSKVETQRDQPWVLLHSYGPDHGDGNAHPDDTLVFVPETHIDRVELRFVRTGRYPAGFTVSEFADPTSGA
jgi:hypothetical protein